VEVEAAMWEVGPAQEVAEAMPVVEATEGDRSLESFVFNFALTLWK